MDSTLIAALLTAGAAILAGIIASIVAIKQGVWVTKKQHEYSMQQLKQQHEYDLQLLQQRMSDKDIFLAWRIAFDRGAFRGPWRWPQSYVDMFEKAIGEVLSAVNTGTVRHSDQKGKGKAYLNNPEWFSKMEEVTGRLDRILRLVREFKEHQQEIYAGEREFFWPQEKRSSQEYEKALQEHQQAQKEREKSLKEIAEAVDHERDEIIEILNKIWEELNIYTMTRPTEEKTYDRDPIAV